MSPKKPTTKKATAKKATAKAESRKASATRVASSKRATQAARLASEQAVIKPDALSGDVLEFVQAIDDYKRLNNRPFPNWSEVLEVLKNLGYERP